jgi:NDP-sugar pyrophosphorylase family protein
MNLPIQIVVLAGGLGTRLRPITETVPKAMVPIQGKPFIHHQLDLLARNEVKDIVLSTGYLSHMIEDYVEDGKRWGVQVRYVNEGKDLRGTGGAVRLVYDHGLLQDRFLVTYGDSYLPISYKKVWQSFNQRREPALMTIMENSEKWDASNACFDGEKVTLYDKRLKQKPKEMRFIDYGLSAWSKDVIATQIPQNEKFDLADLFHSLSAQGLLAGFEIQDRFYEIGSHQGIQDLENYLGSP